MNNSNNKYKKLITPEKAASFIPVFISSFISILIINFFVVPQYKKSNEVNIELNELIKKKNELDNLRSKFKINNEKLRKLNQKKSRIINLISGNSNLDTLIAKFGEIGKKNNIEFVSIIPKEIINFTENSVEQNNRKNNLGTDPLLVKGTKKYLIEFNFKTDFRNLLSFLREIEFQENIILIDDVNVKLNANKIDPQNVPILKIKLFMTIYGKF